MTKYPTEEELQFLKEGDIVRAKIRVWDLPGNPDPGPIHAEPGDLGICIHTQAGNFPTVQFKNGSTCVTPEEVEKI